MREVLPGIPNITAYYADDLNVSVPGTDPLRIVGEAVSAEYFAVAGVRPALGRAFFASEDAVPGAHPVAVISDAVWRRTFGGNRSALDATIVVNGVSLAVIGVMPASFRGLSGRAEIWVPHAMGPQVFFPRHLSTNDGFLTVAGRLPAGMSLERARAHAASIALTVTEDDASNSVHGTVLPLQDARRNPATVRAQLVLSGAAFLVLLIAVVNLAGLLLARFHARSGEIAVRSALGAGRGRLMRHLLMEGAMLGVFGGALGLMAAVGGVGLLARVGAYADNLRSGALRFDPLAVPVVDWRIVVFAGVLAIAGGMLAGLVPAVRTSRGDLTGALRKGARGSTADSGSLRRPGLLSFVAMAQVAAALVLLAGAGQLLLEFQRLRSLDSGIDARNVIAFQITPPASQYQGQRASALLQQILQQVESLPGVESATVTRCLPGTDCSSTPVYFPGGQETDDAPVVGRHYVGPDHFRTLGIPLLRGRGITAADRAGAPRVAVINETAARTLWPGEDAIGKRVWFGSGGGFASPDSLTEIVGIVRDVQFSISGAPARSDFYTSYLQYVLPATMVLVRAMGDPRPLVPSLRSAVASVDPNLPIQNVRSVSEIAAAAMSSERTATVALVTFAALGLFLAAVGVHGVLAWTVAQRRKEIGIRLALGATPAGITRQIVGEGLSLAVVGLATGVVLSLGFVRALSALIPGQATPDAGVLAIGVTILLAVATATCYLPARAAARVDPCTTLAG